MRRTHHTSSVLALLTLLATGTRCIQPAGAQGPPPGASPELKRLAFLVGKWVETPRWFSRSGPVTDVPALQRAGRWFGEGRYLVSVGGPQEPPRGTMSIYGYDPISKEYRLWQFLEVSATPVEWSGRFEGNRLVLRRHSPKRVGPGVRFELGEGPKGGLMVDEVLRGGPAERAGLRPGDVILRVDGTPVPPRPTPGVSPLPAGEEGARVRLAIRRGTREQEITVTYGTYALPARRATYEQKPPGGYSIVTEEEVDGAYRKIGESVFTRGR